MYEDNEGNQIAEDETEALWNKTKEATQKRLKEYENQMAIEKALLEKAEEILAKYGKPKKKKSN